MNDTISELYCQIEQALLESGLSPGEAFDQLQALLFELKTLGEELFV